MPIFQSIPAESVTNTYFEEHHWTTASSSTLENHVKFESQRFTIFDLFCLYYISVAGSFSFIYLRFFLSIFVLVLRKLTYKGKIIWRTSAGSKYNFKERNWMFRLRRKMWSSEFCRLKFSTYCVILTVTKTGCKISNSKPDLRLSNFRRVYLGNKQLIGSHKLTV